MKYLHKAIAWYLYHVWYPWNLRSQTRALIRLGLEPERARQMAEMNLQRGLERLTAKPRINQKEK